MQEWSTLDSRMLTHWGVLAVLGVLLLVSGGLIGYTGLTDTYKHDAWEVSGDGEHHPVEDILTGADLSSAEQSLILDAADSNSPIWSSDPIGLRFRYPDAPAMNEYTIELGGTRYVLETTTVERPAAMFGQALRVSLLAAGFLLLLAGVVPVLGSGLSPGTVLSPPLDSLLETWAPTWALMVLGPPAVLGVTYPVVMGAVESVPLNLFFTPLVIGTALWMVVSLALLRSTDLSSGVFLASSVNLPFLWVVTVALVVAPSTGEMRATLTIMLGLAAVSVMAGQVLGWYTLRWLELRRHEYPRHTPYWRV